MATYFSDHFSGVNEDTLEPDNSVLDLTKFPEPGSHRSRLRYKRAEITRDFKTGDYVRFMQFKSGDRIAALYGTHTATSDGQLNIGLYETGRDHDGPAVESDIFASSHVPTSAHNHEDLYGVGYPDADLYRGSTLWKIATLQGANTWTADPMEDWDIAMWFHTGLSLQEITIILEVYFTSGD